jgi:hypothetical protein
MSRKKKSILLSIFLALSIFIIWAFQTNNPSEKTYSSDKHNKQPALTGNTPVQQQTEKRHKTPLTKFIECVKNRW